ncbi:MAG: Calx-beta domain-containing protein [Bacteroidota bacterium]
MNKLRISLSFLLLLLCTFSCKNDDNVIPQQPTAEEEQPVIPINFEENFGTSVTARFLGRVVDEDNNPIQGATIRIGTTVTTTDLFGLFSASSSEVFERFAYITAEKAGYINGSRALAPSITDVNRVEIMLLKADVIGTITSGEAATVNLSNGTEVSFSGNYTREDGTPYNGQVEVVLKHLSPDDDNMDMMMPGMLFAQDGSGDAVTLETYGMLAVELLSNTGEALQLAEGSTSQITMPIPANTLNPPATIPLWHFDEEAGYWIEEGEATLQGNKYVGEVSHFSFWNYDYPYPSIYLCITLVDDNGNPLAYNELDLYSSLLNTTGTYGFTNGAGVECGLVPANEELTVTVPNPLCQGDPFSTTIGPFSASGNVTITVPQNQNTTTFTGTFANCDGNDVTDGYIQLFINGNSEIIPVTNGTINYTISYCDILDYSLKGVDIINNQVTDVISGTLDGNTTVDLGILSSCTGFEDTDGDGVFDTFEDVNGNNDLNDDDTDDDGIPNYQDADDDGDGINTADEDYDGDGDPTNEDSDGDQIPDYLDAEDVMAFFAEVAGTGCDPVEFDLNAIADMNGNDLHTYAFYLTQADAVAESNPLSSPFGVSIADLNNNTQQIYVVATNNTSGQTAIGQVFLYWNFTDSDGDGLTDCEEITGVDNPNTDLVPNGTSDPNDPNDPNPQPTSTLSIVNVSVNEGDGSATVSATLDVPSDTDTVLDITLSNNSSATLNSDFTLTVQTITIPAGQVAVDFTIPIIDDNLVEQTEEIILEVTVASGNIINASTLYIAIIFINDNDTSNYPTTGVITTCTEPNSDGAFVDLTSMDQYYANGDPSVFISYHASLADAQSQVNALTSPFLAFPNSIVYVAITDASGFIVQVSTLNFEVNFTPIAPTNLSITECDGNADGFAVFNLAQLEPNITQGLAGLTVTYYVTETGALVGTNPIAGNNSFTNAIPSLQVIFFRVEDNQSGCFSVGTIDLIVDPGC